MINLSILIFKNDQKNSLKINIYGHFFILWKKFTKSQKFAKEKHIDYNHSFHTCSMYEMLDLVQLNPLQNQNLWGDPLHIPINLCCPSSICDAI